MSQNLEGGLGSISHQTDIGEQLVQVVTRDSLPYFCCGQATELVKEDPLSDTYRCLICKGTYEERILD